MFSRWRSSSPSRRASRWRSRAHSWRPQPEPERRALAPFAYTVDDGNGHVVRGSVLVGVIDDVEPNRPPVVTADTDKVVVGQSVILDVTSNDIDPDGDPLTVIDVDAAGRRERPSRRLQP